MMIGNMFLSLALFVFAIACTYSLAEGLASNSSLSPSLARAAKICTKLGGEVTSIPMINGYNDHIDEVGVSVRFCNLVWKETSILSVGLSALDPETRTIAATWMKHTPAINPDVVTPHPGSDPSFWYCQGWGGTESDSVKLSLSFENKLGQSGICVFGDGSMIDSWTLTHLSWADMYHEDSLLHRLRNQITANQTFTGLKVYDASYFK